MQSVQPIPSSKGYNAGVPSAIGRSASAAEVIERYLGPGQSHPGETFWRITTFGRPCLVYLHTWANGSQTVTTLDVARPAHQMVLHIEVDPPGRPGIAELVTELRALTTWRVPDDDPVVPIRG